MYGKNDENNIGNNEFDYQGYPINNTPENTGDYSNSDYYSENNGNNQGYYDQQPMNQGRQGKPRKRHSGLFRLFRGLIITLLVIGAILGIVFGVMKISKTLHEKKIADEMNSHIHIGAFDTDKIVESMKEEPSDIEGMTNYNKAEAGLIPREGSDTDLDGLTDKEEIEIYGSDPKKFSTSGDLLGDKYKIDNSLNIKEKYKDRQPDFLGNEVTEITPTAKKAEDALGIFEIVDTDSQPGVYTAITYEIYDFTGSVEIDIPPEIANLATTGPFVCYTITDGKEKDISNKVKNSKLKIDIPKEGVRISFGMMDKSSDMTEQTSYFNQNSENKITANKLNFVAYGADTASQGRAVELANGIEKEFTTRGKCIIIAFPIPILLSQDGFFVFEEKPLFSNKDNDPEFEAVMEEYTNTIMGGLSIKVQHKYLNAVQFNILNKVCTDVLSGMHKEMSKHGLDNETVLGMIVQYWGAESQGDWEQLLGIGGSQGNVDGSTGTTGDAGGIVYGKLDEEHDNEYRTVTNFDISKDTLPFPNIVSYVSEEGNCAGFAMITAQLYNNNLYSRAESGPYGEIVGDGSKTDISYDLGDNEEFNTLFDRHLSDFKTRDYFSKYDDSNGLNNRSSLEPEDAKVVDFIGYKWAESNVKDNETDSGLVFFWGLNDFDIIEKLDRYLKKDKIAILSMGGELGGHAINAYGIEYDKKNPKKCDILVYDNNFPDNKIECNGKLVSGDNRIHVVKKKKLSLLKSKAEYVFDYTYQPYPKENPGYILSNKKPARKLGIITASYFTVADETIRDLE